MTETVRPLVEQAQVSLDAAISCVHEDPNAALDDLVATRLLLATVLVELGSKVFG